MKRTPSAGRLTPPLKWHGGKHYLAKRIVGLMPKHTHFVEAFAGGLSVLLAKDPRGVSEVVNDLSGELTNFWRVLQDPDHFARFFRIVTAVPFSEPEWRRARSKLRRNTDADRVQRAVWFFILCRQSLAGRLDGFAPISRSRTRGGMNEQASAWLSAVKGLPAVHARLKRVAVLNRPALKVIEQQDGAKTLFYCDPPYLHETRRSTDAYADEMTEDDHRDLLDLLVKVKGMVMLSGYPSPLYERKLGKWNRHEFDLANNAAGGKVKRRMQECVWCNF